MARPRVVLGDPSRHMLVYMQMLLEPEFEVVASVGDGAALLSAAQAADPDLIILDFSLAFLDALAVARHLREAVPRTKVVFFTTHEDPDYVQAAFEVGAVGYLVKQRTHDLSHLLSRILRGERVQYPHRIERHELAPGHRFPLEG